MYPFDNDRIFPKDGILQPRFSTDIGDLQCIHPIRQEDQIGRHARIFGQRSWQMFPARMMPTNNRREFCQRGALEQIAFTALAVRDRSIPLQPVGNIVMLAGLRHTAVVQHAGLQDEIPRRLAPAQFTRNRLGDHGNPLAMLDFVNPDKIRGMSQSDDYLVQMQMHETLLIRVGGYAVVKYRRHV